MESFDVIPAIDVLGGRCARLFEGRRDRVTIEGGDPGAAAARFAADGATWLHVVDLDGAFAGQPTPGVLEAVRDAGPKIQVGGGYRTPEAIQAALDGGADRVMVGTAAVSGLSLLADERIVVAIDARDGRVVTDGWLTATDVSPGELAGRCAGAGIVRLLVTSTRRDGSLAGPDLELLAEVLEVGLPVLAAGGVAELDDLRTLRELGCEGAVVGSALWSGRFSLAEALAV
jgi:phosphoribosylformimino-5-aminoimidazole carboxamide ribotide isomerase